MSGLFHFFKLNQSGSNRIKVNQICPNRNESGQRHFQPQHLCPVKSKFTSEQRTINEQIKNKY